MYALVNRVFLWMVWDDGLQSNSDCFTLRRYVLTYEILRIVNCEDFGVLDMYVRALV